MVKIGSIQLGILLRRTLSSRKLLIFCSLTALMVFFVVHHMSVTYKQYILLSKRLGVNPRVDNMCDESDLTYFPNGSVDFRGFNNQTGYPSGCYLAPDIVHLIKFDQDEFDFIEMICIASILINHKPKSLKIHTNNDVGGVGFKGKYWAAIQSLPNFDRVQVVYLKKPTSIFGFSLEHEFGAWHASDIARLKLIQTYGGIYFDSDVFVAQSMHPYRRFEFGLEWNDYVNLGTQIEFGHKDARVIPLWLETYKEYNPSLWYYNAGELPTKAVLEPKPELIHRVRNKFGTQYEMMRSILYKPQGLNNWRDYSCIHLFIRHQSYVFNEATVFQHEDCPAKEMILSVMPKSMFPPDKNSSVVNETSPK